MIKLDEALLEELGLATLPPDEKVKLIEHAYKTMEIRAGAKMTAEMSDDQMAEFEAFADRNDPDGAAAWVKSNFPNYNEVVAAEFEQLKGEIREIVPQLLAASGQQPLPADSSPETTKD